MHRHGWLCGTPGITPSIGLRLQSMPLPVLAHALEPYLGRQADPQLVTCEIANYDLVTRCI